MPALDEEISEDNFTLFFGFSYLKKGEKVVIKEETARNENDSHRHD